VCAWRKSLRNVARIFTQMPLLATLYPKASWLFLTLTVKNPSMSDLRTTLNSMNKAWHRLIELQSWPAEGYIRATEITSDGNSNPHPHFHCMLLVKPGYFKGGNYIDIRKVKSKDQTIAAAVVETLKYAVKPGDVIADPEFLYGITDQCRKLRFLATGGVLKDVLKDSVGDNEMINTDLAEGETDTPAETVPSLFFGWRTDIRKYKLVKKVKV
jgi:plasmid rolling circle replication initiator protein Rep